jgi:hypothetical protein
VVRFCSWMNSPAAPAAIWNTPSARTSSRVKNGSLPVSYESPVASRSVHADISSSDAGNAKSVSGRAEREPRPAWRRTNHPRPRRTPRRSRAASSKGVL